MYNEQLDQIEELNIYAIWHASQSNVYKCIYWFSLLLQFCLYFNSPNIITIQIKVNVKEKNKTLKHTAQK